MPPAMNAQLAADHEAALSDRKSGLQIPAPFPRATEISDNDGFCCLEAAWLACMMMPCQSHLHGGVEQWGRGCPQQKESADRGVVCGAGGAGDDQDLQGERGQPGLQCPVQGHHQACPVPHVPPGVPRLLRRPHSSQGGPPSPPTRSTHETLHQPMNANRRLPRVLAFLNSQQGAL